MAPYSNRLDLHRSRFRVASRGTYLMMSHNMSGKVRRFLHDSRGASMAEYAILVAVIAIVVIAGAKVFGSSVSARLDTAATNVGNL